MFKTASRRWVLCILFVFCVKLCTAHSGLLDESPSVFFKLNFTLNSRFESVRGHWGTTHTAFCEEGYALTQYVAEFWNCLSNCWYVLASLPGLMAFWRLHLELRFFVLGCFLFLIGWGSGIYHATMLDHFSVLDTGPMMGAQGALCYIFVTMGFGSQQLRARRLAGIMLAAISVIAAVVGYLYPASFNDVFLSLCFVYIPLAGYWCVQSASSHHESTVRQTTLLISILSFALGALCWVVDKVNCYQLRDLRNNLVTAMGPALGHLLGGLLQLHAWWHFFTAITLWTTSALAAHIRLAVIGRQGVPMFALLFPWLPAADYYLDAAAAEFAEEQAQRQQGGPKQPATLAYGVPYSRRPPRPPPRPPVSWPIYQETPGALVSSAAADDPNGSAGEASKATSLPPPAAVAAAAAVAVAAVVTAPEDVCGAGAGTAGGRHSTSAAGAQSRLWEAGTPLSAARWGVASSRVAFAS